MSKAMMIIVASWILIVIGYFLLSYGYGRVGNAVAVVSFFSMSFGVFLSAKEFFAKVTKKSDETDR